MLTTTKEVAADEMMFPKIYLRIVTKRVFTACYCVFKEITSVGSNLRDYFENANACIKRTLKTRVATWLYFSEKRLIAI